MLLNEDREKLHELKLPGMLEAFDSQLSIARSSEMSFEDRLGLLASAEITFRENRRLATLLRLAKLKMRADINDINYDARRSISRSQIANLSTCNWIQKGFNVLITGATGTGKTYLACALGHRACLRGFPVQFHKMGLLLDELQQAKIDGSFRSRLKFYNRCALLILDDLSVKARLTESDCELLYEVVDGRLGTGATIVTSQLPLNKWHEYFMASYPTTADAIMDRLLTNATKIELKGESLRNHIDVMAE